MKQLIDWFDEHGPKVWDSVHAGWQVNPDLHLVAQSAPELPVFDLSNVAQLMADKQEPTLSDDDMRRSYPRSRPPYESMWAEYLVAETTDPFGLGPCREGWLLRWHSHNDESLLRADLFGAPRALPGPIHVGRAWVTYSADGDPLTCEFNVTNQRSVAAAETGLALVTLATEVLLLGLSLSNARNIVQQVARPYRPPRKRDKKQLPQREMRVLRLDGRYVERESKKGDGSATPKRLHRYRGHWKEYGFNGHGLLFGKYQCRVWVPDGQRGAAELGVVDKRYEVIPWPKAA